MSEEQTKYLVDDKDKASETVLELGKCWAAIKNEQVIGTISMKVPGYVDFDAYSQKAKECLSMLGDVKAGDAIEIEGIRYFVQRLTHANRSKKPRVPKTYVIKT